MFLMSNELNARPNQSALWLTVAVILSVAVVLGAPFIGEVRAAVRSFFPTRYSSIINGSVAFLVVLGTAVTLVRMRARWGRLLLLVSALALGVGYAVAASTGNSDVDAVERFHFIEYGVLTFCFYQAWRIREDASILILPALAALLVGTFDEWCQWFVPGRVGEIHDVLLNGASIGCGLLASVGINPPAALSVRFRRGSILRIGLLAVGVVLGVAGFLHSAHLGHTIADEEIGAFDSRYSPRDLQRLAEDRALRWQTRPPGRQALLSREDQYLSEALFHVQERNDGNARVAWRENRILEKHYGPVLDIRSGPAYAYRWAPEQRTDLGSRATGDGEPYVSGALPIPVLKWPKALFWIFVTALAGALIASCMVVERRYHRS
jgi:VanZ family protein